MKHKPLIYKFLSLLFLIEPLIKILYFKAATKFEFQVIFENLGTRTSPRDLFDFWLIFPIGGLALIKIRKWSYFVFLFVLAYLVFSFFTYESYTWPYYSDSPLMYHYAVVFLSLVIFIIFLIPDVREPFFNKNIRWWDTKTRYTADIKCKLLGKGEAIDGQILNISQSGAFLEQSAPIAIGDKLTMDFEFEGIHMVLPFKVVSKHSVGKYQGFGVEFQLGSFLDKVKLVRFLNRLKVYR
jgi:hypothetical protein